MKPVRKVASLALVAASFTAASFSVLAQSWPQKPIHVIVPYAAGGAIDSIARTFGPFFTRDWGQPVLVEGQAGAGGSIGATTVAKAPPDGHTILSTTGSTQVQRGFLIRNVPYDPVKDFTPITLSWETMIVIGASNGAPFSNFREMIAYAKANPGKISYGTSGLGTSHHLALEQINLLAGINMVHIPYKGGAQAMVDLAAGNIALMFSTFSTAGQHLASGRLRALSRAIVNLDRIFASALRVQA